MDSSPDNGFIFRDPANAEELIQKIKQLGRIVVPSKDGSFPDLLVDHIEAPATVSGVDIAALVTARRSNSHPCTTFALVVGEKPSYLGIPTLWIENPAEVGRWVTSSDTVWPSMASWIGTD